MLVFAHREPGEHQDLIRLPEVPVGPLGDADARALLASVSPGGMDEAVRDRILYNLIVFVLLITASAIVLGELTGGQEARGIGMCRGGELLARVGEGGAAGHRRRAAWSWAERSAPSITRRLIGRFADRLTVCREISPDTLDALVPAMILQPVVENAVVHGISSQPGPGVITIRSMRDEEFQLEVSPGTTVRVSRAAVRRKIGWRSLSASMIARGRRSKTSRM